MMHNNAVDLMEATLMDSVYQKVTLLIKLVKIDLFMVNNRTHSK